MLTDWVGSESTEITHIRMMQDCGRSVTTTDGLQMRQNATRGTRLAQTGTATSIPKSEPARRGERSYHRKIRCSSLSGSICNSLAISTKSAKPSTRRPVSKLAITLRVHPSFAANCRWLTSKSPREAPSTAPMVRSRRARSTLIAVNAALDSGPVEVTLMSLTVAPFPHSASMQSVNTPCGYKG
jgi:hypothetical protein